LYWTESNTNRSGLGFLWKPALSKIDEVKLSILCANF